MILRHVYVGELVARARHRGSDNLARLISDPTRLVMSGPSRQFSLQNFVLVSGCSFVVHFPQVATIPQFLVALPLTGEVVSPLPFMGCLALKWLKPVHPLHSKIDAYSVHVSQSVLVKICKINVAQIWFHHSPASFRPPGHVTCSGLASCSKESDNGFVVTSFTYLLLLIHDDSLVVH